jgi:hypothetical protein
MPAHQSSNGAASLCHDAFALKSPGGEPINCLVKRASPSIRRPDPDNTRRPIAMLELFLFRGLPADVTERFHRRAITWQKPLTVFACLTSSVGRAALSRSLALLARGTRGTLSSRGSLESRASGCLYFVALPYGARVNLAGAPRALLRRVPAAPVAPRHAARLKPTVRAPYQPAPRPPFAGGALQSTVY